MDLQLWNNLNKWTCQESTENRRLTQTLANVELFTVYVRKGVSVTAVRSMKKLTQVKRFEMHLRKQNKTDDDLGFFKYFITS